MALEHSEVQALKKEILEEADERYVRVDDCTEKQTEISRKFANDDKRIDRLFDKFNTWDKLLWVIASAGIGALVLEFFGLVLK